MKIIIGNRAYSSWSMRGWLAAKLSGLPFETVIIPMDTPAWTSGEAKNDMPSGRVPVLWDGKTPVWDSAAIIEWLADKGGRDRFYPRELPARALCYSISAEMHSGFGALRSGCPMNLKERFPSFAPTAEITADVARIDALWSEARDKFGGDTDLPWLFGAFSAADVMYAPVVTRVDTYGLPVSATARAYVDAVLAHPWMSEWVAAAKAEDYPFDRYPVPGGVPA
ncbi:glutathione S-transferase [Polymorphobacter glacialis]|uniref:Glutathione S-transferase n=1 Tax=Sandarakinorhabdus glacialis TaxID=1614636 RepID=A0A916ZRP2_9SPHN|nr:glutathione S-transferase family protein [Polymorphobacter glacialis]GGE10770.1 glutathione S-transferase [Polymorphobacter glacialis]